LKFVGDCYLQEQAAKEAAAATLKKAWEENFKNCPEDLQAAKKLDAAVKADLAKSKKVNFWFTRRIFYIRFIIGRSQL
jgi:hypothetical protein